ncbi:MGMT family protein [bacterium]|nr:MGMT family protein [bacterium]
MAINTFDKIYKIIKRIPKGKVATYRQIAIMTGDPRAARTVGWALASLTDSTNVPWHRVINSRGTSSFPDAGKRELQQKLLEQEGVAFDRNGRVDLESFQWKIGGLKS